MHDNNFPFVQVGLPIAWTDPQSIQLLIHTWHIYHKTPRSVQDGEFLLKCMLDLVVLNQIIPTMMH